MAKIGVALSGGGYRASLFGLGVLLYLVDAGKNKDVCSISSVSGGSITNGFVAQLRRYQERGGGQFWGDVKPLARMMAHQTAWSVPLVWAYLFLLLASLAAAIYVSFLYVPWSGWLRVLLFLALLVLWGWLLQQRGILAGRALGNKLYSPAGRPTRLEEIELALDHVICATHLNAGEHFYFSGRFVYSYRFGWGRPGGLPLHAAVQASAAFPGGFPPRWMRVGRFDFQGGNGRPGPVPSVVTLSDGGVYDNMADQWLARVRKRANDNPELDLKVPDEIVVVNSSAGLGWSLLRALRLPFFGEFLALKRVNSVMYDNSASLRMHGLVGRFKLGSPKGALVSIEQSPYKVPRAFDHGDTRDVARAAMAKLGDEDEWERITNADKAVKTTLSKLGTAVTARLIRHGYALGMANLSVILGYPVLDVPSRERFEALTS